MYLDINFFCLFSEQSVDDFSCPSGDLISNKPNWLKPTNSYKERHYRRYCLNIISIPTDIPKCAVEVKVYGNPITTLKENSYGELPECTIIGLGWNQINQIEAKTFTGLKSVTHVFLHDNKLRKLTQDAFLGLLNCLELMLQFNLIDSIESGTFNGLDSLQKIFLHDNMLTRLSYEMFIGLRSLAELNIDKNSIHVVESGALSGLPRLTSLALLGNALTHLNWTAFVPDDNAGNVNHPQKLELKLIGNPFFCNVSSCWIRKAEEEGWLKWVEGWYDNAQRDLSPQCSNFPGRKWYSINLDCRSQGKYMYKKTPKSCGREGNLPNCAP